MATKDYFLVFGSGNPATNTGLSPTFIQFLNNAGAATTSPSISEFGSTGLYLFQYENQGSIVFTVDGDSSGGAGLSDADRYIAGSMDNENRSIDFIESFSTALSAQIGTTASDIGNDSVDPSTVFGFLKRSQEYQEGDQTYTKATGVLEYEDRAGVTLLVSKTIVDGASTVTRS